MPDHQSLPSLDQLTFGGERVSHLYPNDCYFAHLSIYHFALPWARGKVVLDAGSGSGYGSNFLAENGATRVLGVDTSELAVKFCRDSFRRSNLDFRQADLQQMSGFAARSFDLIFSSNTLEHVFSVTAFLGAAHSLLREDGALIVAVPPITREDSRAADQSNPYHLNIWTPRQWHRVFDLYFESVQPYRHYFDKPGIRLDFANAPQETRISEQDFTFEPISLDEFYRLPTLTALFVVQRQKPADQLPSPDATLTFVEDSFTRPPVLAASDVPGSSSDAPPRSTQRSLWQKSLHALRQGGLRQLVHEAHRYWLWHTHRRQPSPRR